MEERKEETKQEGRNEQLLRHKIECMLFVAGDPVAITELARVLDLPMPKMRNLLSEMEYSYRVEGRGVQLLVTHDTAQLVSNRDYIEEVKQLVNPDETKSVSQSLLETLAVIAYRQPVTRADVERVRGVRCDYAVTQLQKLDLIVEVGRKDVIGHPTLFGTTDKFLRQFGIHTVDEMPNFQHYSQDIIEDSSEEIPVV
ncbi:Segregation and condensation protein B [bioreactor metagenome]|uniref:Segregation and condensation protein B n=1 Tax=bioreactor metagenome TaxID=1076179 RepID=A0A645DR92_9ZZZZ